MDDHSSVPEFPVATDQGEAKMLILMFSTLLRDYVEQRSAAVTDAQVAQRKRMR